MYQPSLRLRLPVTEINSMDKVILLVHATQARVPSDRMCGHAALISNSRSLKMFFRKMMALPYIAPVFWFDAH
jgi:hypothetical protein